MGLSLSRLMSSLSSLAFWGKDKEVRILMVGLDSAGKTTILYRLQVSSMLIFILSALFLLLGCLVLSHFHPVEGLIGAWMQVSRNQFWGWGWGWGWGFLLCFCIHIIDDCSYANARLVKSSPQSQVRFVSLPLYTNIHLPSPTSHHPFTHLIRYKTIITPPTKQRLPTHQTSSWSDRH